MQFSQREHKQTYNIYIWCISGHTKASGMCLRMRVAKKKKKAEKEGYSIVKDFKWWFKKLKFCIKAVGS